MNALDFKQRITALPFFDCAIYDKHLPITSLNAILEISDEDIEILSNFPDFTYSSYDTISPQLVRSIPSIKNSFIMVDDYV